MSVPALALISSSVITALLAQSAQSEVLWGIFDANNQPALSPDSVIDFHYSRRYDVPTYPVQAGSFANYNKVIQPFEIELRFSASGTQETRRAFLQRLEQLVASTDLYAVVTPEVTYRSCNPKDFEVHRQGGRGAYWLYDVSLYFQEVRQVTAQYGTTDATPFLLGISPNPNDLQNAQNGASLPTSNVGTVYSQPVTSGLLFNAGQSAVGSVRFP
jgi:hypothetical protein